jgi:hypothetical protein
MPEATIKRIFKGSADQMILALTLLYEVLIPKRTPLFTDYPHWADPYLLNLQTTIKGAFKQYIGFDTAKELRDATAILVGIQTNALTDLTTLKKQIDIQIKAKATKAEYLKNLGFDEFYKAAKTNKSQPDLIKFLFRINNAVTATVKNELVAQKVTPALITRLTGYSDTLNNANISQESFKYLSPDKTNETNTALNALYTEAMDVVKLSADFFLKKDKALSKQLSYNAALKSVIGATASNTTTPPSTNTPG